MLLILLTLAALVCITLTGLVAGSLVTYWIVKSRFWFDIEQHATHDYCMCGSHRREHSPYTDNHAFVSEHDHYMGRLSELKVDLFWGME